MIVRLSDFKSNEYANLIGGSNYEPHEENPMIGFRGASRYVDPSFEPTRSRWNARRCARCRNEMGLDNLLGDDPVRAHAGRRPQGDRGAGQARPGAGARTGLKIIMMCEVPSNALLADEFLDIFDGFSIGSNDLTQLTLGLDRDSASSPTCSTNATRR